MYTHSIWRGAFALTACAALSLITSGTAARAQDIYISADTTLNTPAPMASVIIGYANQNDYNSRTHPASPAVRLVSGGSVGGFLSAYNSSTVDVSGGSIGGDLGAFDNSIVNFSGGSVGGFLITENNSTINIFGTGQTATFVKNSFDGGYSIYSLSGTLSDGTLLVNKELDVDNGTRARFTLNNVAVTPEPGSMALLVGLTTVGVSLLRRRRIRK